MAVPATPAGLASLLAGAGCVAAQDEAIELLAAAGGDTDRLGRLVQRRLEGEPLAWITGTASFCGLTVEVHAGVYVPRWQSEVLARRAAERLPATGVAVDLCTGSGAIAKVLRALRPAARVVASDIDQRAVDCARANGVEAYRGDLLAALPAGLAGTVDVVVAVVPYVPTSEMALLPGDTFEFESPLAYDGGPDGTLLLRRVLADATGYLRRPGVVLLELGGDQAESLRPSLAELGYDDVELLHDDEGDLRGLEATRSG